MAHLIFMFGDGLRPVPFYEHAAYIMRSMVKKYTAERGCERKQIAEFTCRNTTCFRGDPNNFSTNFQSVIIFPRKFLIMILSI